MKRVADGLQVRIGDVQALQPIGEAARIARKIDGRAEEVLGRRAGRVAVAWALSSGRRQALAGSRLRRNRPAAGWYGPNGGRLARTAALARGHQVARNRRAGCRGRRFCWRLPSARLWKAARASGRGEPPWRALLALEQGVGGRDGGGDQGGQRFGAPAAEDVVGVFAARARGRCACVRPGARCGSARSSARSAARWPALSPSKQSAGSPPERQSKCSCSSVSAVPHGRDRGDAGALEGDDVEIAFADDEAVGFGFRQQLARLLQAIEHAALGIERGLGRVDVFGLGVLR